MNQLAWSLVALVLFLVALPVLSLGTDRDVPAVWWAGLALVGVAGAIPPLLRYVGEDDDGDDGEEDDGGPDQGADRDTGGDDR